MKKIGERVLVEPVVLSLTYAQHAGFVQLRCCNLTFFADTPTVKLILHLCGVRAAF